MQRTTPWKRGRQGSSAGVTLSLRGTWQRLGTFWLLQLEEPGRGMPPASAGGGGRDAAWPLHRTAQGREPPSPDADRDPV